MHPHEGNGLPEDRRLQIAVAGGSIGGLCAGLALHGSGFGVNVYERHPGPMDTRGAGIVVQGELVQLLDTYGAPPLPTTSCRVRRYLDPQGGDGQVQSMPQAFTSWEAIYETLRAAFPKERYHMGATLVGVGSTSRSMRTCSGTLAASNWRMMESIRARCKATLGIRIFSTPSAIRNYHQIGSRTFGRIKATRSTSYRKSPGAKSGAFLYPPNAPHRREDLKTRVVSQFEFQQRVKSGHSLKLPEIRQCANCGRPELIENDQPQIITRLSAEFPGFDAILRGYAVRGSGLGTWFVVLATKAGGR